MHPKELQRQSDIFCARLAELENLQKRIDKEKGVITRHCERSGIVIGGCYEKSFNTI